MPEDHRLWAERLAILKIAARYGAHHVRIPREAASDAADMDGVLYLLVDLDPNRSLLDHAAIGVAVERLLRRPVCVLVERGLRPEVRERLLDRFVPF
jgi:predicted nucleotidyltransferase